jgi:hypothetical protein
MLEGHCIKIVDLLETRGCLVISSSCCLMGSCLTCKLSFYFLLSPLLFRDRHLHCYTSNIIEGKDNNCTPLNQIRQQSRTVDSTRDASIVPDLKESIRSSVTTQSPLNIKRAIRNYFRRCASNHGQSAQTTARKQLR